MTLPLHAAQAALARTLEAARADGLAVAAVVTDLGGRVVTAARMDGAGFVHLEVAQRKATAAATFGAPTHVVAELAADPLLAGALTAVRDVLVLPGGFPLTADGALAADGAACAGGLGIAGGHYTQDRAVGEAALAPRHGAGAPSGSVP